MAKGSALTPDQVAAAQDFPTFHVWHVRLLVGGDIGKKVLLQLSRIAHSFSLLTLG